MKFKRLGSFPESAGHVASAPHDNGSTNQSFKNTSNEPTLNNNVAHNVDLDEGCDQIDLGSMLERSPEVSSESDIPIASTFSFDATEKTNVVVMSDLMSQMGITETTGQHENWQNFKRKKPKITVETEQLPV